MKGVILAGGLGTRLHPLTKVTNKCLLPVYDRPMIYYPIQTLVASGIRDILLVCGGNAAGEFLRILGNGEEFGLKHLHYTYQKEAKGIADALGLAEEFAAGQAVTVLLADNIFENPIPDIVRDFDGDPVGARIFVTPVEHPECYGVVETDDKGRVVSIVEKPKQPKSNLIATGLYMYDGGVWDYIRSLTPSKRNELEITDLNNRYLGIGKLKAHRINGWWADCGESIDGYMQSCIAASKRFQPDDSRRVV
jgi:glucose-1-phosphate thymidylyltransferase